MKTPSRRAMFSALPSKIMPCPKTGSRTICNDSTEHGTVWLRQNQRAFESTGISMIILGFPIAPLALSLAVGLPASSQGAPDRNGRTTSECTQGKPFGHVRSLQASEDSECVTSSKEEAIPSFYLNCR
jgi:hypothetical protein